MVPSTSIPSISPFHSGQCSMSVHCCQIASVVAFVSMLCSVCHIAASLAFAQMICAKMISRRLVLSNDLGRADDRRRRRQYVT
jgi:hypothetical protein